MHRYGEAVSEKRRLRAWARALAPATALESAAVAEGVHAWLHTRPRSAVLVYLAMPGEVDLSTLTDLPGAEWLTTRTPGDGGLTVHRLDAPREVHPFGYEQPAEGSPEVAPVAVDVVLVPGLAFDVHGNRLGWGKGFYDELLSRMRPDVVTIGITLERRIVADLPVEPHDRPMDWLATEHGVRRVSSG